jgi:hypothetical protein
MAGLNHQACGELDGKRSHGGISNLFEVGRLAASFGKKKHGARKPRASRSRAGNLQRSLLALMFPAFVKSFLGSYPDSRRLFIYMSWFLLLAPTGPAAGGGGAPTRAYAFIALR